MPEILTYNGAVIMLKESFLFRWFAHKKKSEKPRITQAIIRSMDETGITVNNHPLIRFELEVNDRKDKHFNVMATRIVTKKNKHIYKTGNTVKVNYDPRKKTAVII